MSALQGLAGVDGSSAPRKFSARRWLRRFAKAGGVWIVAEDAVTIGWPLTSKNRDQEPLEVWLELDAAKRSAVRQSILQRSR